MYRLNESTDEHMKSIEQNSSMLNTESFNLSRSIVEESSKRKTEVNLTARLNDLFESDDELIETNGKEENKETFVIQHEQDEDEEESNEIYLCFLHQKDKMACSYYDSNKKELFYMLDIQENNKFELTNLLINELNPYTIITNTKCEENFMNFLKLKCIYWLESEKDVNIQDSDESLNPSNKDSTDESPLTSTTFIKRDQPIQFELSINNDFDYEIGKNRIIEMSCIENMPKNMTQSERILFFSGLFDFECKLMIRSIGALLKYLDRKKINFEFDDSQFQTPIYSVRCIHLDKILLVDFNSLKSLQIFNNVDLVCANKQYANVETNNFRSTLNNKFNNTLYSLYLTKVQTKIGIGKLRSYLMCPTRDENVLRERHEIIEFFLSPRNQEITKLMLLSLKKCKYINPILKRMRTTKASVTEWKRLYKTTQAFLSISTLIKKIYDRINETKTECGSENDFFNLINERTSRLSSKTSSDFKSIDENETILVGNRSVFASLFANDGKESTNFENRTSQSSLFDDHSSLEMFKQGLKENLFGKVVHRNFGSKFDYLINVYEKTINIKESIELKKCKVNANISAKLDEKKYIYSKIAEYLTKIAHQEIEKYKLNYTQVMYIPNLGFLLVLNKDSFYYSDISLNASSILYEDGNDFEAKKKIFEEKYKCKLEFKSNDQFFYKDETMYELDKEFGDFASDINELESEIIHKLQGEFIKHSHVYANMIEICAELDCLLAFAQIAKEHDYVKPHLDMSNSMINAKKVRHPLVEMYVEHNLYVPNDVKSGQFDAYSNKIKLITGPNASGKTVYLKQVALLVYMTMIGSYVAASEAIVGDFDRIFTRLNSNESVSMQLSAFSIDLEQMSIAINNSTSKSLVIVDEFGKGTDISDGQALIAAIIRFWINKEENSTPHIYFSTHFYEMLHNAEILFSSNNSKIEYLTFDYLLSENVSDPSLLNKSQLEIRHSKDIIQLYNLIKGIAKSSHAINILKKVGMPERLIKRAEQLYTMIHECMNSNDESLGKDWKKDLVDTPEADHFFTNCKEIAKEYLELFVDEQEEIEVEKFRTFLRKFK